MKITLLMLTAWSEIKFLATSSFYPLHLTTKQLTCINKDLLCFKYTY